MRFGDRAKFGTQSDIGNNLKELRRLVEESAARIHVRDAHDYLGFSLHRIADHATTTLLTRLIDALHSPIDLQAWITRNLFELSLLSQHIVSSDNAAQDFLAQKASDEIEIYEGMLSLSKNPEHPSTEPARVRIAHIRRALKKYNLRESRHWSVSWLASQTGDKEEWVKGVTH